MREGLELFDLSGRCALVTGSSQGIGLTLASGLAAAGARVVLNGRDEQKLAQAAAGLAQSGKAVTTLAFDVTDHDGVRKSIDGLRRKPGPSISWSTMRACSTARRSRISTLQRSS